MHDGDEKRDNNLGLYSMDFDSDFLHIVGAVVLLLV